MSIPNENQKIVASSDNFRPVPVELRAVMPRNEEENMAREYLLGAVRKRDEALAKIEDILDNHSFGYDVDAPTVVEADLIREVLASLKDA
jgi:hypothetical protein